MDHKTKVYVVGGMATAALAATAKGRGTLMKEMKQRRK